MFLYSLRKKVSFKTSINVGLVLRLLFWYIRNTRTVINVIVSTPFKKTDKKVISTPSNGSEWLRYSSGVWRIRLAVMLRVTSLLSRRYTTFYSTIYKVIYIGGN